MDKLIFFKNDFDLLLINPYVRYMHEAFSSSEAHEVPERMLYDFALIYVQEGELLFKYNGKSVTLGAGDCHIMPPLVKHKEFIKPKTICKYINIHFDMVYCAERRNLSMQKMYLDYCGKGIREAPFDSRMVDLENINYAVSECPVKRKIENQKDFLFTLEMLQTNYEKKLYNQYNIYDYLVKKYMLDLLSIVFDKEEAFDSLPSIKLINSFIFLVRKDIARHFDYDAFAVENGYTPNYFRSIFKKVMGVTPWQYVKDVRMKKAELLLTTTNMTVKEIAFFIGINDQFYFSKIFKDETGFSPSEYRRNSRNGVL